MRRRPAASADREASGLSGRVGIDQGAPATAVELRPLPFWLGEAVSDRIDGGGMVPKPEMAALNLDVFGQCAGPFDAAAPSADAVAAAENRRRWNRRRFGEPGTKIGFAVVGAPATGEFIDAPRIGRAGMSCERAAECDDYAHVVRTELGELARIKTAETPSDEADLASASLGYFA